MSSERSRLFSAEFDDEFFVNDAGGRAYFGRNVLRGLIEGIDEFVASCDKAWRNDPHPSPALLACALWIDDDELLDRLRKFSAACVVMTKQRRTRGQLEKLQRLQQFNQYAPGLPIRAFPELGGLAPHVDGQPLVVGPSGPSTEDIVLPTIRTVGYRKSGDRDSPPLMHAKLVLLGGTRWLEGEFGEEFQSFTPSRLWVSSANLTGSSRRSLEFGYWTTEHALLEGAERFLLRLIAASEGIDPDADVVTPDLAPYEFDDEAMREALAEFEWDDEDEES